MTNMLLRKCRTCLIETAELCQSCTFLFVDITSATAVNTGCSVGSRPPCSAVQPHPRRLYAPVTSTCVNHPEYHVHTEVHEQF